MRVALLLWPLAALHLRLIAPRTSLSPACRPPVQGDRARWTTNSLRTTTEIATHLTHIMDIQQRGRSPSAGQHIRQPSASPHAPLQHNLAFDPSALSAPYDSSTSFATTGTASFDPQFLSTTQAQQFPQQTSLADSSFLQPATAISQHNTPHFGPSGNNISPEHLDISNNPNSDFNTFFPATDLGQGQAINAQFLGGTLDPHMLEPQQQQQNQSINPSDLMNQMATTQHNAPTPPHLLPTMNNHQTPSPHASPNLNQGAFISPGHSRHASLDPSAAYGQNTEWANMTNFRQHRRTPSEAAFSDVSSAHASPYMQQQDSFETDQPSPLLNPQADPQLFQDPVMRFNQFNLNENNSHISPGHSPHISPRLMPQQQQSLPQFQPDSFGLNQSMGNQFQHQGLGTYQNQGPEPFPSLNQPMPEFGHADAMSPPEINIDFAPPSRQASFEPSKPEHQADALSPPDRCKYSHISYEWNPF